MTHTLGRADFDLITAWIAPGDRVLDLGCGDGTLLKHLIETRGVHGWGVEIDDATVLAAIRNGINVIQGNLENGLDEFAAMDFEYIVCDSPAGIETGALMAMHFADEALVVTNPEVSSVRDSDRILGMLSSKTKRGIEGLEPIKEHPPHHPPAAAQWLLNRYGDSQSATAATAWSAWKSSWPP